MNLKIEEYVNLKFNKDDLYTKDAFVKRPGDGWSLGRVDHFMKKSTKSIVDAYIKQYFQRDRPKAGEYIIEIVYTKGCFRGEKATQTICVTVS